jgi:hypothetical protein
LLLSARAGSVLKHGWTPIEKKQILQPMSSYHTLTIKKWISMYTWSELIWNEKGCFGDKNFQNNPDAAWRGGCDDLKQSQGVSFYDKRINAVVNIDLICFVCVLFDEKYVKALAQKIKQRPKLWRINHVVCSALKIPELLFVSTNACT